MQRTQASAIFNACLDRVAGPFHALFQDRRWGLEVAKDFYLGILCFADNYWIVATSPRILKAMLGYWLGALNAVGFHTPHDELTWCTIDSHEVAMRVSFRDRPIKGASRKDSFKVFGSRISFDNAFEMDLSCRIDKAWKAFYCNAEILCCKEVALGRRLRYLETLVGKVLFWGAWSLKFTKKQLSRLNGVQQRMVRKMIGLRRPIGQSLSQCEFENSQVLSDCSIRNWGPQRLAISCAWMGDLARLKLHDRHRITYILFKYRDLRYIVALKAKFGHQTHDMDTVKRSLFQGCHERHR